MTGSTATSSGATTMRAGSLLDDNQWHDVEIDRMGREVNFTVDRLTITNMTNGDFFQLDLDRYVSFLWGLFFLFLNFLLFGALDIICLRVSYIGSLGVITLL